MATTYSKTTDWTKFKNKIYYTLVCSRKTKHVYMYNNVSMYMTIFISHMQKHARTHTKQYRTHLIANGTVKQYRTHLIANGTVDQVTSQGTNC